MKKIAILIAVSFLLPRITIAESVHAGGCPEGRPCPEEQKIIHKEHVSVRPGGCPEGPPCPEEQKRILEKASKKVHDERYLEAEIKKNAKASDKGNRASQK